MQCPRCSGSDNGCMICKGTGTCFVYPETTLKNNLRVVNFGFIEPVNFTDGSKIRAVTKGNEPFTYHNETIFHGNFKVVRFKVMLMQHFNQVLNDLQQNSEIHIILCPIELYRTMKDQELDTSKCFMPVVTKESKGKILNNEFMAE